MSPRTPAKPHAALGHEEADHPADQADRQIVRLVPIEIPVTQDSGVDAEVTTQASCLDGDKNTVARSDADASRPPEDSSLCRGDAGETTRPPASPTALPLPQKKETAPGFPDAASRV